MVSPARCRDAVRHLIHHFRVSERRACRALEINRSSLRYVAVPVDYEKRLVKRMNELAVAHPRWGYRMVATLLRGEGWKVNPKRVLRLWRQEGNRVLPRRSGAGGKKSAGSSRNAGWRLRAKHPHHIWGMDFMSSRTRRGGPIRIRPTKPIRIRAALGRADGSDGGESSLGSKRTGPSPQVRTSLGAIPGRWNRDDATASRPDWGTDLPPRGQAHDGAVGPGAPALGRPYDRDSVRH